MDAKEPVIIGEEEIGKTTLANALLSWDIFPAKHLGSVYPNRETRQPNADGSHSADGYAGI